MDVPVCLEDCFDFLFLVQKLPALLLCSFIWEVGVQSFSTQQKDRAWAALLSHRLVSCERWRDSSALVKARPYCHIE